MIGAGMAGATCARCLADAGHSVQVFDKSRGTGGRLATRRAQWAGDDGVVRTSPFDHGAPGFTANAPDFLRFAEQAEREGLLARWVPEVAPGSGSPLDAPASLWVPVPDMPAWCRALLAGVPLSLSCPVDALRRGAGGWSVAIGGGLRAEGFSDVVVAIPPRQAAPLLQPHRPGWAQRAQALSMSSVWTLMGVTADAGAAPGWDLAWPPEGALSWIVRNDAKPRRERVPGQIHWVVHATGFWSRTHLETPAAEVQALLQEALAQWLGQSLTWHHAAVHRWRYASVAPVDGSVPDGLEGRCWWDASLGLGVCGDALGGAGVEGAWASARALAAAIVDRHRSVPADSGLPAADLR